MNSVSDDDMQAHPPTLVGATILQIVPALREEPVARTALDVVAALRQAGARALVAAEEGPLVAKLTASGGEWIPLVNATVNPAQTQRPRSPTSDRLRAHRYRARAKPPA